VPPGVAGQRGGGVAGWRFAIIVRARGRDSSVLASVRSVEHKRRSKDQVVNSSLSSVKGITLSAVMIARRRMQFAQASKWCHME
jgi:hypothetical protein